MHWKKRGIFSVFLFLYTGMLFFTSEFIYSRDLEAHRMKIESEVFLPNQKIPSKYTCEGENLSPPLRFSDIPKGTQSFVLIVDDPDAPRGTFDHWITWDIPSATTHLTEGVHVSHQGKNGFGVNIYRGPCPPPGSSHRYFFKLYALDTMLNLPEGSSKSQVEKAMQGHILDKAEVVGTYQRK